MELTLITGNAGKAKEFGEILGFPVKHTRLPLVEPQELDVSEVARSKASQAFDAIGVPVMVDDTALSVNAWNGLPGALISWFMDTVGNEGILRMAADLTDRSIELVTAVGYADSSGVRVFTGTVHARLALKPTGTGGFGYDPIVIPDGTERTYAQMSSEEKNAVSMRRLALEHLKEFLA